MDLTKGNKWVQVHNFIPKQGIGLRKKETPCLEAQIAREEDNHDNGKEIEDLDIEVMEDNPGLFDDDESDDLDDDWSKEDPSMYISISLFQVWYILEFQTLRNQTYLKRYYYLFSTKEYVEMNVDMSRHAHKFI